MPVIKLEGKEYEIADPNGKVQGLVAQLKKIDARLGETKLLLSVLSKAKDSYISDLKSEMLAAKAGLEFNED